MADFTVGIFVYDQVEVLDFAGPYEVFTTAARVFGRHQPSARSPFRVVLIGETANRIRARAGLQVVPDHGFDDHPPLDLLLVPGGVVSEVLERPSVVRWITDTGSRARIAASVCTGVFLLAKAGLLSGKSVTTHWEDIDELRAMFPGLDVRALVRWVDQENIVTSAGISAGMDMSLHLVERMAGRDLALQTAHQMEFDWTECK